MDKREAIQVNGFLLFPVKENEKDFTITEDGRLRSKNTVNFIIRYRPLPAGNYEIIGLARDLTEDQWKEIVDSFPLVEEGRVNNYYPDFTSIYKTKTNPFIRATESGLSLLKSHSLSPDCLILKKL